MCAVQAGCNGAARASQHVRDFFIGEAFGIPKHNHDALVGRQVFRWQTLNARARSGVIGNGAAGTAEKGELLLQAYAARLAEILGTAALWSAKASDRW